MVGNSLRHGAGGDDHTAEGESPRAGQLCLMGVGRLVRPAKAASHTSRFCGYFAENHSLTGDFYKRFLGALTQIRNQNVFTEKIFLSL